MNSWYKQKAFFLIAIGFFFSELFEIKASKYLNTVDLSYNQLLKNTDSNDSGKLSSRSINWAWLYQKNYVERQMPLISLSDESILQSEQYPPSKRQGFGSLPQNIAEILEVDNWLARQQNSCQNINSAYQQVYSFQTDNYYINICQDRDSFYYHRQSKLDDDKTLLIPAQAISHGGVFQATSRGITYFVGKDGDRYYSSVMQNDNEIVFEPELPPSADTVLAKDIAETNSRLQGEGIEADRATNASLSERPENYSYSSQQTFCTGANTSNSYLNWQELLGESLYTASQYAFNNGYSFIYDAQTPEQALITTSAAIVNLNIAVNSDTIEQVCIRPLAEN